MNRMRNAIIGAGLVSAMAAGGAVGPVLFSAGSAGAATPTTTSTNSSSTPGAAAPRGQFHSNEATGHEQGESAAREAAENNGTATYGPPPGSTSPGG